MADSIYGQIHMSYAELVGVCQVIHAFMLRDTAEFAGYAIDSADITAFNTKIEAFIDLPSDSFLSAVLIDATDLKNTLASELRVMLRSFDERARLSFPNDMGKYGLFHSKELSKLSDDSLFSFGTDVSQAATLNETALAAGGVTALMITNLGAKIDAFSVAKIAQKVAIADRDAATTNRAEKALELYKLLVSHCETGKVIWNGVNQAYYNDYVIFGASGQLLTLVPPYDFAYDNTETKFIWSVISNATSYEIEQSLNHVDWTQLWTGTATEYAYIPPGGVSIEYRCRARNSSGYGPYSDAITIIYVEPLPAPATVAVTADYSLPPNVYLDLSWSVVPGATFYKVFESMVNFGQPEGTFTDIGDFVLESMRKLSIRNRRYYFKVHACNTATQSGDSMTVYVDIPG